MKESRCLACDDLMSDVDWCVDEEFCLHCFKSYLDNTDIDPSQEDPN